MPTETSGRRPLHDQAVSALLAALVQEGVEPRVIEKAVARTMDIQYGRSIAGNDPLVRAFAFEQAGLFERHWRER